MNSDKFRDDYLSLVSQRDSHQSLADSANSMRLTLATAGTSSYPTEESRLDHRLQLHERAMEVKDHRFAVAKLDEQISAMERSYPELKALRKTK